MIRGLFISPMSICPAKGPNFPPVESAKGCEGELDENDWTVEQTVVQNGGCEVTETVKMNALAADIELAGDLSILEDVEEGDYLGPNGERVAYAKYKAESSAAPGVVEYGIICEAKCEPGDKRSSCSPSGCLPYNTGDDDPPLCTKFTCRGSTNADKCKGACQQTVWAVGGGTGVYPVGMTKKSP